MKKVILVLFVFVLALFVLGCDSAENNQTSAENDQTSAENQETSETTVAEPQETTVEVSGRVLEKVLEHLASQGLEVSDVYDKNAELIGAVDGLGFDVAGGPAEIYLFDPETADADLVDNLENARNTEKFMMNTMEVSSIMNGNIMLTGYEIGMVTHPEKDKLVEAFKRFRE